MSREDTEIEAMETIQYRLEDLRAKGDIAGVRHELGRARALGYDDFVDTYEEIMLPVLDYEEGALAFFHNEIKKHG